MAHEHEWVPSGAQQLEPWVPHVGQPSGATPQRAAPATGAGTVTLDWWVPNFHAAGAGPIKAKFETANPSIKLNQIETVSQGLTEHCTTSALEARASRRSRPSGPLEGARVTMLNRSQLVRAPVAQVRFVRLRRETNGMLFVLPTVLVLLAIIGYPVLETLRLSLSQVQLGQTTTPFIGLANSGDVLGDRVSPRRFAIRSSGPCSR